MSNPDNLPTSMQSTWRAGCLLSRQFGLALVQAFPNITDLEPAFLQKTQFQDHISKISRAPIHTLKTDGPSTLHRAVVESSIVTGSPADPSKGVRNAVAGRTTGLAAKLPTAVAENLAQRLFAKPTYENLDVFQFTMRCLSLLSARKIIELTPEALQQEIDELIQIDEALRMEEQSEKQAKRRKPSLPRNTFDLNVSDSDDGGDAVETKASTGKSSASQTSPDHPNDKATNLPASSSDSRTSAKAPAPDCFASVAPLSTTQPQATNSGTPSAQHKSSIIPTASAPVVIRSMSMSMMDDEDAFGEITMLAKDVEALNQKKRLARNKKAVQMWVDTVREDWLLMENIPVMYNVISFFTADVKVLKYCLFDLFIGADATHCGSVSWNELIIFLADCSSLSKNKNRLLTSKVPEISLDDEVPGDIIIYQPTTKSDTMSNRVSNYYECFERSLLFGVFSERGTNADIVQVFDAQTFRILRTHELKKEKLLGLTYVATGNYLVLLLYDEMRVVDADNWVLKASVVAPPGDGISVVQSIPEISLFGAGTRGGNVLLYDFADLDRQFFSNGALPVDNVPHIEKHLHLDGVIHVHDRLVQGSVVCSSLDATISFWALESGVVRKIKGAIACKFDIADSLGIVFGYGVDPWPFVWNFNDVASKPVFFGGSKGTAAPHTSRIVGIAVLTYPRNSGISVDRQGNIRLWDLWEKTCLQSITVMNEDNPVGLAENPCIRITSLLISHDKMTFHFPVNKCMLRLKIQKKKETTAGQLASLVPISCVAHCPETRLFLVASGNSMTIWNTLTCSPIHALLHVSPSLTDEILDMKVYETTREILISTTHGYIVTVAMGNAVVRSNFRHPSKKKITCFMKISNVGKLIVSANKSAISIHEGDVKPFTASGMHNIGFASVSIQTNTSFLIGAHDNSPVMSIWDISPQCANLWICLARYGTPRVDKPLMSPRGVSPRPEGGKEDTELDDAFRLITDLTKTNFCVGYDTCGTFHLCELVDYTVEKTGDPSVPKQLSRRQSTLSRQAAAFASGPLDTAYDVDFRLTCSTQRAYRLVCRNRWFHCPTSVPVEGAIVSSALYISQYKLFYCADSGGSLTIYDVSDVMRKSLHAPGSVKLHSTSGQQRNSRKVLKTDIKSFVKKDSDVWNNGDRPFLNTGYAFGDGVEDAAFMEETTSEEGEDEGRETDAFGLGEHPEAEQSLIMEPFSCTNFTEQIVQAKAAKFGVASQPIKKLGSFTKGIPLPGAPIRQPVFGTSSPGSPAHRDKLVGFTDTVIDAGALGLKSATSMRSESFNSSGSSLNLNASSSSARFGATSMAASTSLSSAGFSDEVHEDHALSDYIVGTVFRIHCIVLSENTLNTNPSPITSMAFLESPLCTLVTSTLDGRVKMWTLCGKKCGQFALGPTFRDSLFAKLGNSALSVRIVTGHSERLSVFDDVPQPYTNPLRRMPEDGRDAVMRNNRKPGQHWLELPFPCVKQLTFRSDEKIGEKTPEDVLTDMATLTKASKGAINVKAAAQAKIASSTSLTQNNAQSFFITATSSPPQSPGRAPVVQEVALGPTPAQELETLMRVHIMYNLSHEEQVILYRDWRFAQEVLVEQEGRTGAENTRALFDMSRTSLEDVILAKLREAVAKDPNAMTDKALNLKLNGWGDAKRKMNQIRVNEVAERATAAARKAIISGVATTPEQHKIEMGMIDSFFQGIQFECAPVPEGCELPDLSAEERAKHQGKDEFDISANVLRRYGDSSSPPPKTVINVAPSVVGSHVELTFPPQHTIAESQKQLQIKRRQARVSYCSHLRDVESMSPQDAAAQSKTLLGMPYEEYGKIILERTARAAKDIASIQKALVTVEEIEMKTLKGSLWSRPEPPQLSDLSLKLSRSVGGSVTTTAKQPPPGATAKQRQSSPLAPLAKKNMPLGTLRSGRLSVNTPTFLEHNAPTSPIVSSACVSNRSSNSNPSPAAVNLPIRAGSIANNKTHAGAVSPGAGGSNLRTMSDNSFTKISSSVRLFPLPHTVNI